MGQLRDPLVGRDVLFGVILGDVLVLIFRTGRALEISRGAAPEVYSTDYL